MRQVVFEQSAFKDFAEWALLDKKLHKRIIDLITDALRQPFSGLGKPEPLKHNLKGYWSRRINDEHRLVYTVTGTAIIIVSCKYHYS
jgi:toxin YoeB